MKNLKYFVLFAIFVCAIACNPKNNNPDPEPLPPVMPPEKDSAEVQLSFNVDVLEVKESVDTRAWVHVRSNRAWSVSCAERWCTPASRGGQNDDSVELVFMANTSLEVRSTELVFRAGDVTKTIAVRQVGESPAISLTKDNYNLAWTTLSLAVEVRSNVELEVETPAWIIRQGVQSDVRAESRFMSKYFHTFTLERNESGEVRHGMVIFKGANSYSDVRDTVFVAQDPVPAS